MSVIFRRVRKYTGTIMLSLLLAFFAVLPAYAADIEALGVKAELGPDNDIVYTFKLWQPTVPEDGKYSLSLPYEVKSEMITFELSGADSISFDGKTVAENQAINAPAEGVHTVVYGGKEYKLTVFYGADIPSVYITTESGSMDAVCADKSNKESGTIAILDREKVQYNGVLDQIKGRGNATWSYDKKPFNIKLEEKADLFGMGKQKGWSLLANFVDVTSVRNKTAIDFAETVGIDYSSKSKIVDLYADGEYMGNYTLIEKVEIDDNRVEITSLEDLNEDANPDINIEKCEEGGTRGEDSPYAKGSYKYVNIPVNPEDITGGYLLEYELQERYDAEVSGFVTDYGQCIVVKSPEYASKEQVEYISQFYQEFEDAVRADNGVNSLGKHYSEYLDVESMAKMYVFQEYMKNLDAGATSFFLYKDTAGKLVAAPVWDFDMALGHKFRTGNIELSDAHGYLATGKANNNGEAYTIISLLCQHGEFRQMAAQQWEEVFAPEVDRLVAGIDTLVAENHASLVMNKNKWTDGFIRSVADVTQWYNNEVAEMQNFLKMRADFMDEKFSTDNLYIQYASNGAEGEMLESTVYTRGDITQAEDNKFTNGEREFLGWNTQADGNGTTYMPGDEITMEENVILYAQWEKPSFFERIAEFFANLF